MNALVITAFAATLRVPVARRFERLGFATFIVSTAEAALLIATAVPVEVAFVDAAGLAEPVDELLARLRALRPGVRVVSVRVPGEVAVEHASSLERALPSGATMSEVDAAIDAVLATRAARGEHDDDRGAAGGGLHPVPSAY